MRESVGSTWIFQLAIIFILIFSAYLAITINYSKTFKVKNEVISILEKYEGLTDSSSGSTSAGSIAIINNYLLGSSYKETGSCPDDYYGARSLSDGSFSNFEISNPGTKYYYCIKRVSGYNSAKPGRSYFRVIFFTRTDLPILGNVFTFNASGRTIDLDRAYGL